jgi:hypothetical protein
VKLDLSPADLAPLVREITMQVIDQLREDDAQLNGRLAYPEAEAAALCGVRPHVLRDCRLRGEITATKIGRHVAYERDELLAFLRRQRKEGE